MVKSAKQNKTDFTIKWSIIKSILLDLFIKWAYLKQNLQNYKFEVAKS